jgi:hypothetical protein
VPEIPANATLVSPDGLGYLVDIDAATDKQKIHLEGDPYQMGYQHGYLIAEKVRDQTTDAFFKEVIKGMINNDIFNTIMDDDTLWNLVLGTIIAYAETNGVYATQEMRDEMQGIADGANARLTQLGVDPGNVTYGRVLLINTAFDVILGVVYPYVTQDLMTNEQREAFWASDPMEDMHMCDGFVALDSATQTSSTIMTRSFMIPSAVTNKSVIMEYEPYDGNRFVAVNMPGWVGTAVAMNEYGVAIGVDMVPCLMTSPVTVGMGCLLTCRYAMQFENNTSGACRAVKESVARGVPWIYIIGDKTSGAVAEAAATTGFGWADDQAQYFAARYTDYVFDASQSPDPLIQQYETRNDLVTVSNHFLDPTVQSASGSFAIQDSLWRYGTVTTMALDAITSDGISVDEALALVRYLNPTSTTGTVGGSRTVFDMAGMTLYTRYNQWSDPVVVYTWPDF